MRKIKILVVALTAMATTNGASAQVFEEGNVGIDLYYGFPNLYSAVFKAAYANSGSEENVQISGLGPVGLRGEYMLSDKVGLGLDIGFNNTKISFEDQFEEYNSETGTYETRTYEYNYSTQKIGAMVTFNYHFFVDNDNFDVYAVAGMGYGNRSFKFESTDPDYVEADIKSVVPVASKIGLGMRYFFTDNIGLNLAIGLGQGGVANAGVSFKF